MNLYLDDDVAERRLIALLERAGHTVTTPEQAGLRGAVDARHLIDACQNHRVLMSRNHDDFLDLHLVIKASGGAHPGILIIRFDNDPTRDMTPRGIVAALTRLEVSRVPIASQFVILNHWR
jgi:predicted nuclease of predicted toxin-antitoxin system